ncbi:hypothetical protein GH714_011069 [Hevea brasiliensis]|uniref:Protein kinase domain-containing protein n=1 Tax=Hevea brasiliensis TaxID=3981 RepID=A0A6A6N1V6_HEVBR|nr:hypothetical protein GH714_011069 [Hevea brasiliensis]
MSEIASIGRLRHRNLVQLLGWCRRRGDLLLVYDFMPNGSLDKYLFDEPQAILKWEQRDIKAGNVLLDSELNGRLGDFGLAKLYERGSNPSTTRVVGTLGYLAPELTRTGKPTTSSDVFAFGALLLEVVCGRRPIEPKALPEELILVDWCGRNGKVAFNEAVVRYLEGEVSLPEVVAAPDAYDGKKGDGGSGGEFEDYVHSFPLSSNFEKLSTWSCGVIMGC